MTNINYKPKPTQDMRGVRPLGGPGGGGPQAAMRLIEKPKDFKGTMKKLIKYLRPFWFMLIISMLFSIISTICNVLTPRQMGYITTELYNGFTGLSDRIDYEYISRILILLMVLYIASAVFQFIQSYISNTVSQKIGYALRKDMSDKFNRLPISYFDNQLHGEILSRVTNDIDTVSFTLNQSLSQITSTVTQIIGVLVMMLIISPVMTGITVLIVPLTTIFVTQIVKRSQKYFKLQQKNLGNLNGHVEEMFSGHNILKVFNGEERSINRFGELNKELYKSSWISQFLSGLMMPITIFIGNLGYVGVCVAGGYLVITNQIQVGDIQAFIRYVRQFNMPMSQTAGIANTLQSTAAAAERVFLFLSQTDETPDIADPVILERTKGNVKFEDVIFGYQQNAPVIKQFTADITSGQKIAIVGPTGVGKTTIVNLLMRFYDVGSGSIKIDGFDIREMTRKQLRSLFGMVLQDAWLFHGTIKENIAYGKSEATDAEVFKAAELACADHFILTQKDGYDMVINEEANNISSGQKQLLTIARTILANKPILILDEATSNVDTRTEILIQKAMDNLMMNRTSFIIAHRLSTIKNADVILVMDKGNIVEQGKHDELLALNGFYANLYYSQFDITGQ